MKAVGATGLVVAPVVIGLFSVGNRGAGGRVKAPEGDF